MTQDIDQLYLDAVDLVVRDQKASVSYVQRRLAIRYSDAADLVKRMERAGVVSEASVTGRREVLTPYRGADAD